MEKGKILVCDDEVDVQNLLRRLLEARGHGVECFGQGAALLKGLEEMEGALPDLVILDAKMPGLDGLEVLRRLKAAHAELPVVMMSAFATVRNAVDAMKLGALDYLIKPFSTDEVHSLVDSVIERNRLVSENRSLKAEIRRRFNPEQIIFKSEGFSRVFALARKVASSGAGVLILGESGTGKELIASTIHYSSERRDQRFLTINCAAITDTLLESQLFGHVKGAFTGAVANHRGLVEEADKGTLFLDEIGDLSPALQAKLLRLLQEKEFMPVGATRVRHADVRFVAATNKDLEKEVARGNFREDLFYRLNVVTLEVPPLRERRDDILPLAEHFVRKYAPEGQQKLSAEAARMLQGYHWPGNVRELENTIEMAVILAEGGRVEADCLPSKISNAQATEFVPPDAPVSLEDVERLYIAQVYRQTGGHKLKTSEILGIARKTLDRKLRQYGIDLPDSE
ncbi:sigma-54-dependent transcriptional regulator [Geoalkalibacter subterraneus]|uniref:DNA-binding transcriptional regulator NtrC n=1 Tax=Geoalkalibacter subterraneus TaxID=483547 RepID=A0A0B5FJC2_9BACT|nr:sigma-54 dependent transcriptional regulator [Geoalkalibacter subterraneus]AJF07463.1 chemotaxis protein CheY [Geoalkalibacter subterraneus]